MPHKVEQRFLKFARSWQGSSKKGKGKQQAAVGNAPTVDVQFAAAQIAGLEAKLDVLVHLGYGAIALTQVVEGKVDPKVHVNQLDPLLSKLKQRENLLLLKRLSIVMDETCDKGFGLTNNNQSYFSGFDIISVQPCNASTFSLACLTHSIPSPLTAHIISIPLTLPRLPFHLKHTLVRTAIKNGACFEMDYDGAMSSHDAFRMNWWAAGREVMRVTRGKGLIVSSGCEDVANYRPPRDVANLMTLLGVAQDVALESVGKTVKSLLIRAQTRKTYRAVLSEPRIVYPTSLPAGTQLQPAPSAPGMNEVDMTPLASTSSQLQPAAPPNVSQTEVDESGDTTVIAANVPLQATISTNGTLTKITPQKRTRSHSGSDTEVRNLTGQSNGDAPASKKKKKKRKKNPSSVEAQ